MLLLALCTGCAALRPKSPPPVAARADYDEAVFARKDIPAWVIPLDERKVPAETVIGEASSYTIRPGDTLLDVARYHDLGYNEIVAANPGVDPWVPEPGSEIVLPTQWVLPCCTYRGIVVNIPEMRLYHFRHDAKTPRRVVVHTYPVGLGRDDRRTPRGTFRIDSKTENPQWNIPESIRREHIAERGDARRAIPGGAPDNPLGAYRLGFAESLYAIHGTNVPWGVGRLVSHGCLRLYPEDIAQLFPMVPVGTKVAFVYQPVKAGVRAGRTYVEAHPDVYRRNASLAQAARTALGRRKLERGVDARALRAALEDARGLPVEVSPPAAARAPRDRGAS